MNALHDEVNDVMQTLFQRYPALCGFSVREDLGFQHLACNPPLYGDDAKLLQEEIACALSELFEERPEAAELLRGRTLARVFH